MMYYNENLLYTIASSIGTPVKIDINTRLTTRGRFARVCVEIDLTKPLVAQFWLDQRWHSMEYEGIHTICFACGRYGHRTEHCRDKSNAATKMNIDTANGATPTNNATVPAHNDTVQPRKDHSKGNKTIPNPTKNVTTTSAFGHGLGMIASRGGLRPRGEKRMEKNVNKEQSGTSNRFGSLMLEDLGNLQESHQVLSHKSP